VLFSVEPFLQLMLSHLEQDSTDDSDFVRLQRLNHGPSFASSQEELDLYFGELKF
jgi:hypothetical protein